MMYVQTEFDIRRFFHIYVLKVDSFSEFTSMICDGTTSLEPNVVLYAIYTSVLRKLEARMDFSVKEEAFFVQHQTFEMKIFA